MQQECTRPNYASEVKSLDQQFCETMWVHLSPCRNNIHLWLKQACHYILTEILRWESMEEFFLYFKWYRKICDNWTKFVGVKSYIVVSISKWCWDIMNVFVFRAFFFVHQKLFIVLMHIINHLFKMYQCYSDILTTIYYYSSRNYLQIFVQGVYVSYEKNKWEISP